MQHGKLFWSFAAIVSLNTLSAFVIFSSVTFWLFRFVILKKSDGFSEIASFDVAYQSVVVIMLITGATTSVALQMFSGGKDKMMGVYKINMIINIVIVILFSFLFSCFSSEIMSLYGDEYVDSYYLIYVVCGMTIFATVNSINNKLFISNNNVGFIFINTILSSIMSLLFVYIYSDIRASLLLSLSFFVYYFIFFIFDVGYISFNYKRLFNEDK